MNIKCDNIKDFCELINISAGQGIKDIYVFSSINQDYPSVAFETSKKDNKSFIFIFFTPLYTAIYSGNEKSNITDEYFNSLKEICLNHEIRIHSFDNLKYNSNNDTLSINTHSETI